MERDRQMELVRSLTQAVMETVCPEVMSTFGEDFAAFALHAGLVKAEESSIPPWPKGEALETTLVAGMFFQALLEAENLPADTEARVAFICRQAKSYLATKLAGQITLPQFFRLLNLIEENVQRYFERSRAGWLRVREPEPSRVVGTDGEAAGGETKGALELSQALREIPEIPRSRGKLTLNSLESFLKKTGGEWFRLLDFEEYFQVNKKTAWAYLHQLLKAGILVHNGGKANKVRYALAARFCRNFPPRRKI